MKRRRDVKDMLEQYMKRAQQLKQFIRDKRYQDRKQQSLERDQVQNQPPKKTQFQKTPVNHPSQPRPFQQLGSQDSDSGESNTSGSFLSKLHNKSGQNIEQGETSKQTAQRGQNANFKVRRLVPEGAQRISPAQIYSKNGKYAHLMQQNSIDPRFNQANNQSSQLKFRNQLQNIVEESSIDSKDMLSTQSSRNDSRLHTKENSMQPSPSGMQFLGSNIQVGEKKLIGQKSQQRWTHIMDTVNSSKLKQNQSPQKSDEKKAKLEVVNEYQPNVKKQNEQDNSSRRNNLQQMQMEFDFEQPNEQASIRNKQKQGITQQPQQQQQQQSIYPDTRPQGQDQINQKPTGKSQDKPLDKAQQDPGFVRNQFKLEPNPDGEPINKPELTSQERKQANSFSDVYAKIMKNSRKEKTKPQNKYEQKYQKIVEEQTQSQIQKSQEVDVFANEDHLQNKSQKSDTTQDEVQQKSEKNLGIFGGFTNKDAKQKPKLQMAQGNSVLFPSNNSSQQYQDKGQQKASSGTNVFPNMQFSQQSQGNSALQYPQIDNQSAQQPQYSKRLEQQGNQRFPMINHIQESRKDENQGSGQSGLGLGSGPSEGSEISYPNINFLNESKRYQSNQQPQNQASQNLQDGNVKFQNQAQQFQNQSLAQTQQYPTTYPQSQQQSQNLQYPSTKAYLNQAQQPTNTQQQDTFYPSTTSQINKKSENTQGLQQAQYKQQDIYNDLSNNDNVQDTKKPNFPGLAIQQQNTDKLKQSESTKASLLSNQQATQQHDQQKNQQSSDDEHDPFDFDPKEYGKQSKDIANDDSQYMDINQFMGISSQYSNASNFNPNMLSTLMTQRTALKGRLNSLRPGDKVVLQGKLAKEIDDLDKLLDLHGQDSMNVSDQGSFRLDSIAPRQQFNHQLSQINENESQSSLDLGVGRFDQKLDFAQAPKEQPNVNQSSLENSSKQNQNDFSRKRFGNQNFSSENNDSIKQYNDLNASASTGIDTFDQNSSLPSFNQSKVQTPIQNQFSRLMGYDSTAYPMSLQMGMTQESQNMEQLLAQENKSKINKLGNLASFKQIGKSPTINFKRKGQDQQQKQKEEEEKLKQQREKEEQDKIKQEELLALQKIERLNENNEIDELFQNANSQYIACENPLVLKDLYENLLKQKQAIVIKEDANNEGLVTQVNRTQQIQTFKNDQNEFLQKLEDYQIEQNKLAIKQEQEEKLRKEQEANEKRETEKKESQRMLHIRREQEKLRQEKLEQERKNQEKQAQIQKEQDEILQKQKLEQQQMEYERQEQERIKKEQLEQEKLVKLEKERQERIEKERKEKLEREKRQREEQELLRRQEEERLRQQELERIQLEAIKKERLEKERQESEKLKQLEKQKQEQERMEREQKEKQIKLEQEKQNLQRVEAERQRQQQLLDEQEKQFKLNKQNNNSTTADSNTAEDTYIEIESDLDNNQVDSSFISPFKSQPQQESDLKQIDNEEDEDKFEVEQYDDAYRRKEQQDLLAKQQQIRQNFSANDDLGLDVEVDQSEDDQIQAPPQTPLQSLGSRRMSKQMSHRNSYNFNRQSTFDYNQAEVEQVQLYETNSLLIQLEKYQIDPDQRTQNIMKNILDICLEIDSLLEQNYSNQQLTFAELVQKNVLELSKEEQVSGIIDNLYINPNTVQDVKDQLLNSFNNVVSTFVYLYGAQGSGKSDLMCVISKELGAKYIEVDTWKLSKLQPIQAIQAIDTMFTFATQVYKDSGIPVIINFDEIDRLFEKQNQVTNITYISARLVQRWLEIKFEKKIDYEITVVGVTRSYTVPPELFQLCIDVPIYVQTPEQRGRFQYFMDLLEEMSYELKQEEVEAIIFSCKYYTFKDLQNLCAHVWEQQIEELWKCQEFAFDNGLQLWRTAIGKENATQVSIKDLIKNERIFIQPNEGYMYLIGDNDEKTRFLQLIPAKYDMFLNSQLNIQSIGQDTKEQFEELNEKIIRTCQDLNT